VVTAYARESGLPFPVLLDMDARVADGYGIRGTPAHLLVNSKGDLAAFAPGAKDWKSRSSRNLIQFLLDMPN
jgi:hypothetical protein